MNAMPKSVAMMSWLVPRRPALLFRALPLTLLGVLLLAPFSAAAVPTPLATGSSVSWAYAGWSSTTSSGSFSNGMGSFEYQVHAFYGWDVAYTQTNTSASTFEVHGQRVVLTALFAQFCQPSCGASGASVQNLSVLGHQDQSTYANLTSLGTVDLNGTTAPALAMQNDAGVSTSNLTSLSTFQGAGPSANCPPPPSGGGSAPPPCPPPPSVNGWTYWSSETTAQLGVDFAQPLGMVPTVSVAGDSWDAATNYTYSSSTSQLIHVCQQVNGGPGPCGSAAPTWAFDMNGTLGLLGGDLGPITLQGGLVAQQDTFGLMAAPFAVWDSLFLVPAPAMVMPPPNGGPTPAPPPGNSTGNVSSGGGSVGGSPGPAPAPNGPGAPGSMGAPGSPGVPLPPTVGTNMVDVASGLPHLGFVAAMSVFAPPGPFLFPVPLAGASPAVTGTSTVASTASISPSASTASPGQMEIQAEPVSTSTAASLAADWNAWTISFPSSKGPHGSSLLGWPVAVLAAVAVAAVLLVLLLRAPARSRVVAPRDPAFEGYARRPEAGPSSSGAAGPRGRTSTARATDEPGTGEDPMDRLL